MTALPTIPLLESGGQLRKVPVSAIRVSVRNPRTDAEETVDSLAASLGGAGIVQYPIVIRVGDDEYELVDGERRWRAAQAAGRKTLYCLVRDAGTPTAILFTQILANLHREDLGPLDESVALKTAWLVLNAQELGLMEQADAILSAAQRLREAIEPLRMLLEESGWHCSSPLVSQAVFVERLGLGMSASVLKKKLQILSANDAIQESARQHKLTGAAIRALMTLEPEQQAILLQAINEDPPLGKSVRSIVQGVKQKGRTIEEAIAVITGREHDEDDRWPQDIVQKTSRTVRDLAFAQGVEHDDMRALMSLDPEAQERVLWAVTDAAASEAPMPIRTIIDHAAEHQCSIEDAIRAARDRSTTEQSASVAQPSSRPVISDDMAMNAVLPIIELAQDLQTRITQFQRMVGPDVAVADLPSPWGDYALEAVRLITTTIQPYSS